LGEPSVTFPIVPEKKKKREHRKRVLRVEQQARHDQFYAAYPRKEDPARSEKAWLAIDPDQETFEKIMAGMKRYADYVRAAGRPIEKIKHPATWINARAWESEYNNSNNPAEADWANKKPEDIQDALPF
jgi:hypothetical protein